MLGSQRSNDTRVHNEKRRTTAIPTRRMSSSLGLNCLKGPTLSFLGRPSCRTPPIKAKNPQDETIRKSRPLSQDGQSNGQRNPDRRRAEVTPEIAATRTDLLIFAAWIPTAISETPKRSAA